MQERAVQTRQLILQAAARVFAEKGYEAATIADVLDRSRVTKGALYFHFPSKPELAVAVMTEQSRFLSSRTIDEAQPLQQLVDLSYDFCRALQRDPVVQASIRLTVERATFAEDSDRGALYGLWLDHTKRAFDKAKELGQLRAGWRPADLSRLVVGGITGLQIASTVETNRADLARRIHVLWSAIVPAVVEPDTAASLRLSAPRAHRR